MKFFIVIMLVLCLSFIDQKAIEARPSAATAGKFSWNHPGDRRIVQLAKRRGQPGRLPNEPRHVISSSSSYLGVGKRQEFMVDDRPSAGPAWLDAN